MEHNVEIQKPDVATHLKFGSKKSFDKYQLGNCETTTMTKSDGSNVCGIYLSKGLTWQQAQDQCSQVGARLPEILTSNDNTNFMLWKVNYLISFEELQIK